MDMENIVRLKNKYSGLIVFTKDYEDVYKYGNYKFIRVYDEKNPQRTYLANRDAFEILNK